MSDYDAIVDAFVEWAIGEPRVRALWLESRSPVGVRRPYSFVEIHVAADEPDMGTLLRDLPQTVRHRVGTDVVEIRDAGRGAHELRFHWANAGLDTPSPSAETPGSIVLEATSMLPKRPRAYVATLVDRTKHLTHVMDFSLRGASR